MHLNRVARVVVMLSGLTVLGSIVAAFLGAHVVALFFGSVIFTLAAAVGASKLHDREQNAEPRRQQQEQVERQRKSRLTLDTRTLDPDCADLVRRAVEAVKTILASEANAENLLDPPVDEELLKENVQAISVTGRKITDLRARQGSIIGNSSQTCDVCGGRGELSQVSRSFIGPVNMSKVCSACGGSGRAGDVPSPMTSAVLEPQQQALAMVLESAASRVENLERYASSVTVVDATYKDWVRAQDAERLNDEVRGLLADTAKDKLAAEEFNRRTERTVAAEQDLRRCIHEANLAAEILALPGDEGT
jgi:hypothetical protein